MTGLFRSLVQIAYYMMTEFKSSRSLSDVGDAKEMLVTLTLWNGEPCRHRIPTSVPNIVWKLVSIQFMTQDDPFREMDYSFV